MSRHRRVGTAESSPTREGSLQVFEFSGAFPPGPNRSMRRGTCAVGVARLAFRAFGGKIPRCNQGMSLTPLPQIMENARSILQRIGIF